MQKGQHEYATRKAHELFDAWNDVTGVFPKFTGYYYEILSVVEDAVRVGSMVALGIDFEIKDGEITMRATDAEESATSQAVSNAETLSTSDGFAVTSPSAGNADR